MTYFLQETDGYKGLAYTSLNKLKK